MQIEAIESIRERDLDAFIDSAVDILSALAPEETAPVSPRQSVPNVRVSARRAPSRVALAATPAAATANLSTVVPLDEPSVHGLALKENIEKLVSHLQLENDVQTLKVTQQRLEQVKNIYEKRHKFLMKKIEEQIAMQAAEADNKTLGTIFRWVGVVAAIALAAVASVVSGGAAVALIIAAAVALAMAITEEAGGFEAMQKSIAKNLEGKGMSHREAQQKASYIVMGVQLAVTIAVLVATMGAGSAGSGATGANSAANAAAQAGKAAATGVGKGVATGAKVGETVGKVAEKSSEIVSKSIQLTKSSEIVNPVAEAAEEVEVSVGAADQAFADVALPGMDTAYVAKATQSSTRAAVKLMNFVSWSNAIAQISNMVYTVATAVIQYRNAKKMYAAELLGAEVMEIQAAMEVWEAYLDENMEDLKTMMKTVQNQFKLMEEITASRLRTATEITDMIGGMA